MLSLLLSFITSTFVTLLIIRFKHLHETITNDHLLNSPQKIHSIAVPRIGGLSVAIGIAFATLSSLFDGGEKAMALTSLTLCVLPAFGAGFTEDITKNVDVRTRLFFTAASAGLVSYLLNAQVPGLDLPGIDLLFTFPIFAIAFSCFAVAGLANAYNLIDGLNGLASMVALITLCAIAYVSIKVGDTLIASLAFVMIGAIGGFFIWNYPMGSIFLGDGGSYLIGYWIGVISILLVSRHKEISPWFALLVNGYPICETLFTIYRRKIHQGKKIGHPDSIHFHTLLFHRVLSPKYKANKSEPHLAFVANARTSPYLWLLSSLAVAPAMIFWQSTYILQIFALIFVCSYIYLYKKIVTFRTPKWLV
jgi:UDP-N-acetylmuramyl pentapeptide phosphotransferase/UDP-N-acetylglucosamine-1-phosphate transferase